MELSPTIKIKTIRNVNLVKIQIGWSSHQPGWSSHFEIGKLRSTPATKLETAIFNLAEKRRLTDFDQRCFSKYLANVEEGIHDEQKKDLCYQLPIIFSSKYDSEDLPLSSDLNNNIMINTSACYFQYHH